MTVLKPMVPLCLALRDWPAADRLAWEEILSERGLFDDRGSCCHWAEATRKIHRRGYGEWLSFLARNHPATLDASPQLRVMQATVMEYIDEMNGRPADCLGWRVVERLSPKSQASRVRSLYFVIQAFAPEEDWAWLKRASWRLLKQADPEQLKPRIPVSAAKLFQWGLKRLEEIEQDPGLDPVARAVAYRNALAITLLIACPVRRRAFCALDVEERLQRTQSRYVLKFRAADMKDKQARSFPLHGRLTRPLDTYLRLHRPVLLGGRETPALWVSQSGAPVSHHSMYGIVTTVTAEGFGYRLSMHDFRRVAATSIAECDPAHAGIIRDVLGHATMDMAGRYYNQAQSLDALNRYQQTADGVRRRARDRGR